MILRRDDGTGLGILDRGHGARIGILRRELERLGDAARVRDFGVRRLARAKEVIAVALRGRAAVSSRRPQHVNLVDGHRKRSRMLGY